MSQGSTHMAVGVLIGLIAIYMLPVSATYSSKTLFLLCVMAGSVFPDIDTRSRGRTLMYYLMIPAYAFMIYHRQLVMCLLISLTGFLPIFCVHRGLFHRLWFIAFLVMTYSISMAYTFPYYSCDIYEGALFFFGGAISHLVLDL